MLKVLQFEMKVNITQISCIRSSSLKEVYRLLRSFSSAQNAHTKKKQKQKQKQKTKTKTKTKQKKKQQKEKTNKNNNKKWFAVVTGKL